jgi:hypothetical protein
VQREYPYAEIAITDQAVCMPYLVITPGQFAPMNNTFGSCDVHTVENNANHPVVPDPDPGTGGNNSGGGGGWWDNFFDNLFG